MDLSVEDLRQCLGSVHGLYTTAGATTLAAIEGDVRLVFVLCVQRPSQRHCMRSSRRSIPVQLPDGSEPPPVRMIRHSVWPLGLLRWLDSSGWRRAYCLVGQSWWVDMARNAITNRPCHLAFDNLTWLIEHVLRTHKLDNGESPETQRSHAQ